MVAQPGPKLRRAHAILLPSSAVSDPERRGWGRETLPELVSGTPSTRPRGDARAALVVLNGPQVGQRLLLDEGVVVGRDPSSDLVLRDDRAAWRHARFDREAEGWRVEALDPLAHPVEVEGIRASRFTLAADDRVQVGGTVLRYELHGPAEDAFYAVVQERLSRDELTGLVSRRVFDVELAAHVEAAIRGARVLAVLVLDLDALKAVNDRHGHIVGARVIAEVGRALGSRVPEAAIACRLGGDEFAVTALVDDRESALALAGSLRDAVGALALAHDGEPLDVSISVGVAILPDDASDPFELLRAADAALLRAKRRGRGSVST